MTTTPQMSLVLPTPGGDIGSWDDEINAALTQIDGHDNTTGKGPKVPVAGLNINASISLSSLYSITNIASLDFASVAALTSGVRRLFFNAADGELYVRTNAGVNVKITSGASLNSGFPGAARTMPATGSTGSASAKASTASLALRIGATGTAHPSRSASRRSRSGSSMT